MSGKLLVKGVAGTILRDQLIPNTRDGGFHPQRTDFYIPSGTVTFAAVVLHGGASTKEQIAAGINISWGTVARTNWALLNLWQCIAVFPQGWHCSGVTNAFNPRGVDSVSEQYPNGVGGWSSGFMWSEADDVQFLKDLATHIQNTYGAIGRVLCGHSAGGLMAQRMWYEWSVSYGHYCTVAGPASGYLFTADMPVLKRPIFTQYGRLDTKLGIYGGLVGAGDHFYEDTWRQDPGQIAQVDVSWPVPGTHVSGWKTLQQRVAATSAESVTVEAGVVETSDGGHQMTTWKYNADKFWLRLIEGVGHSLTDQAAAFGHNLFNQWMLFAYTT